MSKLRLALNAGLILAGMGLASAPGGASAHGDRGPGACGPEAMFDMIDADGDGRITPAELEAHRAARFAEVDADGDGRVTKAELEAHMLEKARERMAERLDRMFTWMDADGDGALGPAEFAPGTGLKGVMLRLDADGDGAVTRDEVENAAPRHGRVMRRGHHGEDHHGEGGPRGGEHADGHRMWGHGGPRSGLPMGPDAGPCRDDG